MRAKMRTMWLVGFVGCVLLVGSAVNATVTAPDAGGKLAIGYDGSNVTITEGTLVDSWNDQISTRGVDNASAGGSRRPQLVTVNTGNGNHQVVDFNGAQYLKTSAFANGDMIQTNVIFLVASFDTTPAGQSLFDGISSDKRNALYVRPKPSGTNGSYGMYAGSQIINENVLADTGSFHVFAASFTNGSNGWLRIDGNRVLYGDVGSEVLGGLSLGSNYGASGFFNGKIAEVLVYDGGLNTAQIESIESYLTNKYLVPEPASAALISLGLFGFLRRK